MAYSVDLRSRVVDFVNQGHTQEEAGVIFNVGTATIQRWIALLSEIGNLEKRPLNRIAPKFDSEKLNAYKEDKANAQKKTM